MKSETKALAIATGVGAAITGVLAGVYHKLWKEAYISQVQALFAKTCMESWAEEEEESEEN